MTYSDLGMTQEDFNFMMALSGLIFMTMFMSMVVYLFIKR